MPITLHVTQNFPEENDFAFDKKISVSSKKEQSAYYPIKVINDGTGLGHITMGLVHLIKSNQYDTEKHSQQLELLWDELVASLPRLKVKLRLMEDIDQSEDEKEEFIYKSNDSLFEKDEKEILEKAFYYSSSSDPLKLYRHSTMGLNRWINFIEKNANHPDRIDLLEEYINKKIDDETSLISTQLAWSSALRAIAVKAKKELVKANSDFFAHKKSSSSDIQENDISVNLDSDGSTESIKKNEYPDHAYQCENIALSEKHIHALANKLTIDMIKIDPKAKKVADPAPTSSNSTINCIEKNNEYYFLLPEKDKSNWELPEASASSKLYVTSDKKRECKIENPFVFATVDKKGNTFSYEGSMQQLKRINQTLKGYQQENQLLSAYRAHKLNSLQEQLDKSMKAINGKNPNPSIYSEDQLNTIWNKFEKIHNNIKSVLAKPISPVLDMTFKKDTVNPVLQASTYDIRKDKSFTVKTSKTHSFDVKCGKTGLPERVVPSKSDFVDDLDAIPQTRRIIDFLLLNSDIDSNPKLRIRIQCKKMAILIDAAMYAKALNIPAEKFPIVFTGDEESLTETEAEFLQLLKAGGTQAVYGFLQYVRQKPDEEDEPCRLRQQYEELKNFLDRTGHHLYTERKMISDLKPHHLFPLLKE